MTVIMGLVIFIVGIVAGVLSGMFGIGGGVVIVPVLTTLLGFGLQQAVGTSLGALLMPVGVFAVLEYRKAGKLELGISAIVAAGLIFGGWVGAQIALSLPVDSLQKAYGAFLLLAGWRFAEPRKWWAQIIARRAGMPAEAPPPPAARTHAAWWALLLVGLGAGIISGMFGVGGGIVIVPALVALLGFDQKMAVGTSLGALLLPVGAGAVASYYQAGQLDVLAAALVAGGLVIGAFGGAKIALGLSSATIKRLYGVFLFLVALRFLFGN